MTTAHKITTALVILVTIIAIGLGVSAFKSAIANATLTAQTQANKAVVVPLDTDNKRIADQLASSIAALQAMKMNTRTSTQIVHDAPQVIQLPAPIREYAPPTPTPDTQSAKVTGACVGANCVPVRVFKQYDELDEPQKGDLIIPAASANAWFDSQITCKQNALTTSACTQTHSNDQAIIAIKDRQIAEDQIVIKGGTKTQRFKAAAKWLAIGVGAGAVTTVVAIEAHH